MDVKQLIRKLNDFDTNAIVTVGEINGGWSNIELVVQDGACVKIAMSDNVIFSDDCTPEVAAEQRADNTGSPKLRENIIERLEAVQCIVASACSEEESHCAYEELDSCIAQLRANA